MSNPSAVVFQPLYQQIKSNLTDSLVQGQWRAGEMIPSEFELAAHYGVSQGTVRKAIDELVTENVLMRRQGKGTFVTTHDAPRAEFRFLRLVSEDGEAIAPENRILGLRRIRATTELARQLAIKSSDSVVEIERLQIFNGVVANYEHIWLRAQTFRGLTLGLLQAHQGSMYAFFEKEFAVTMVRAEEKIRAIAANAIEAEHLQVPTKTPLLSVFRCSFTYGEQIAEVRHSRFLTDKFHYQHQLN